MATTTINEAKKSGPPPRAKFYTLVQQYAEEALNTIVDIMRNSRNESLKFAAARSIVDKTMPDLKSVEVGGELDENGKRRAIEILVNAGRGFLPATVQLLTSSNPSATGGQPQIQNPDLAPESPKDNNINIGSDKAGPPSGGSVLASISNES